MVAWSWLVHHFGLTTNWANQAAITHNDDSLINQLKMTIRINSKSFRKLPTWRKTKTQKVYRLVLFSQNGSLEDVVWMDKCAHVKKETVIWKKSLRCGITEYTEYIFGIYIQCLFCIDGSVYSVCSVQVYTLDVYLLSIHTKCLFCLFRTRKMKSLSKNCLFSISIHSIRLFTVNSHQVSILSI